MAKKKQITMMAPDGTCVEITTDKSTDFAVRGYIAKPAVNDVTGPLLERIDALQGQIDALKGEGKEEAGEELNEEKDVDEIIASMTANELKGFAVENNIDLTGIKKKIDIAEAIKKGLE